MGPGNGRRWVTEPGRRLSVPSTLIRPRTTRSGARRLGPRECRPLGARSEVGRPEPSSRRCPPTSILSHCHPGLRPGGARHKPARTQTTCAKQARCPRMQPRKGLSSTACETRPRPVIDRGNDSPSVPDSERKATSNQEERRPAGARSAWPRPVGRLPSFRSRQP